MKCDQITFEQLAPRYSEEINISSCAQIHHDTEVCEQNRDTSNRKSSVDAPGTDAHLFWILADGRDVAGGFADAGGVTHRRFNVTELTELTQFEGFIF